jgi:signal transduction histidine kinase
MRRVRVLVWLGGAVLCALSFAGALREDALPPGRAVAHYVLGLAAITVALIVWDRRPDSRIGPLMTAALLLAVVNELPMVLPASALAVTAGLAAVRANEALLVHVTLAYPTGRLTDRLERWFVVAAYAFAAVSALPLLLFYDPRHPHDPEIWECASCARPLTHVAWFDVTGVMDALDYGRILLVALFLVLLVRKVIRAAPGPRRIVLPLATVTFLAAARYALLLGLYLTGSDVSFWRNDAVFWSETALTFAIPLVLAGGLLWAAKARGAAADLVVELADTPPGSVRDALARALGDPSLELGLWLPDRGAYVDPEGRPLTLPGPDTTRAVTKLGDVAALVHDPALLERRGLLAAAGAAARLALENERLQAQLRAQLSELRESRARIVRAGDEERRRLERDLHDGAQQRLLSIGLALQLARAELGEQANGANELLAEADAELRAALDELRELARGIHPAVLTEHGLAAALTTLAARSPVPVQIGPLPEARLPEATEAAAYFLVSEALANVVKHAGASRVKVSVRVDGCAVVEVEDDGVGGADAVRGSGLRGLSDRVHALDGRLEIDSPAGGGTRMHAELPCA